MHRCGEIAGVALLVASSPYYTYWAMNRLVLAGSRHRSRVHDFESLGKGWKKRKQSYSRVETKDFPISSPPPTLHSLSLPQNGAAHRDQRNKPPIVRLSVGGKSIKRSANGDGKKVKSFVEQRNQQVRKIEVLDVCCNSV